MDHSSEAACPFCNVLPCTDQAASWYFIFQVQNEINKTCIWLIHQLVKTSASQNKGILFFFFNVDEGFHQFINRSLCLRSSLVELSIIFVESFIYITGILIDFWPLLCQFLSPQVPWILFRTVQEVLSKMETFIEIFFIFSVSLAAV